MNFIERLMLLIKENKISKGALTQALHIGKNQIKYWEDNNNIPDGEILLKIANYFNVSVDYLVGKSEMRNPEVSLSGNQQKLLDSAVNMSDDEVAELIKYADYLKSKRE